MRPAMPPNAVPPTYSPTAKPRPLGSISSNRYAITTAGTPPSRMPSSSRAASNAFHCGRNEAARLHSAANASETNISLRRPNPSDSAPATTIEIARLPVVSDSANALAAGLTP